VIVDIVFSWNVLTATLVAWLAVVSLALAADFGPEIYRERKAHAKLQETVMRMAAQREARKPMPDPDETMQLGVFTIKPAPAKRRHARV